MDLIDRLGELAARIARQKDTVLTEEAAKTAFVLPFLQALGYDVFNPAEVVPELTADHGVKKGEKVDYAIAREGRIVILIECKPVGADLAAKHAGQLFRYFSVTEARFGVLTDGIRYVFFSDLERENRMDDRPFFEFNLLAYGDAQVEELKKFSRSTFDLDTIISTANKLKYLRALGAEIRNEFESPSDELTKMLLSRVYSGRLTQQVRQEFAELVPQALKDYVRGQVNARLKSALDTDRVDDPPAPSAAAPAEPAIIDPPAVTDDGIETTEDELHAFRIIRAVAAEFVDPERVVMRDAKSYCAILFDDNNRRPICRLHFGKSKLAVTIFDPAGEQRHDLESVNGLYRHKAALANAVNQYAGGR